MASIFPAQVRPYRSRSVSKTSPREKRSLSKSIFPSEKASGKRSRRIFRRSAFGSAEVSERREWVIAGSVNRQNSLILAFFLSVFKLYHNRQSFDKGIGGEYGKVGFYRAIYGVFATLTGFEAFLWIDARAAGGAASR